ncbi:hypothetical protein [Halioxenophilus aromaticivorans]|uniref:Globin n=1 Tax=Halioxenophilus aromaticivorans TaxID=1306992 RepID=A0AAV3U7N0_9ALTE
MAPVFLEHALIDINEQLQTISLYWQKMFFGNAQYNNHLIKLHRTINAVHAFEEMHFQRWLSNFEAAMASFSGLMADRSLFVSLEKFWKI